MILELHAQLTAMKTLSRDGGSRLEPWLTSFHTALTDFQQDCRLTYSWKDRLAANTVRKTECSCAKEENHFLASYPKNYLNLVHDLHTSKSENHKTNR